MSDIPNLPGRTGATNNNTYYNNRTSQVLHNLTRSSDEKYAFLQGNMKDDVKRGNSSSASSSAQVGGYNVDLKSPGQRFNQLCNELGVNRFDHSGFEKATKEQLLEIREVMYEAMYSGTNISQSTKE